MPGPKGSEAAAAGVGNTLNSSTGDDVFSSNVGQGRGGAVAGGGGDGGDGGGDVTVRWECCCVRETVEL